MGYTYASATRGEEDITMRGGNICKFVQGASDCGLIIGNFVYESNTDSMRTETRLQNNKILLVTGGKGSFTADGLEFPCRVGDMLFLFDGEITSVREIEELCYVYISFSGVRGEELLRRFGINRYSRRLSGCDGLIPTWREALSLATDDNIDLVAESMLLYAFSRFGKRDSVSDSLISRIIEISEKDFTNPTLSLGDVAKRLSYNPKYISHIFKERMGMAYTEYLRMIRVKYAISLFEHGLDSIKNVALLSGYSDPLYFSTVFKKTVGMSPKEYIGKIEAAAAVSED